MRERPILFAGEMVREVLADRKTQTRRVVKTIPLLGAHVGVKVRGSGSPGNVVYLTDQGLMWRPYGGMPAPVPYPTPGLCCPYGQPGDLLCVRETFAIDDYRYLTGPLPKEQPADVIRCDVDPFDAQAAMLYYRADGECCEQIPECQCRMDGRDRFWRPSIHMPRWASRLTLRVTDVRVERVQDISPADIRAEGVELPPEPSLVGKLDPHYASEISDYGDFADNARRRWRELWDSINGKRGFGWDVNPWVWAVTFEPIDGDR